MTGKMFLLPNMDRFTAVNLIAAARVAGEGQKPAWLILSCRDCARLENDVPESEGVTIYSDPWMLENHIWVNWPEKAS